MKPLTGLLLAVNLGFLAWAATVGAHAIEAGSGTFVTNGTLVAGGIVATLLIVAALPRVLPRAMSGAAVDLALVMQALHAGGHLLRLYYAFAWYDDLLHFATVVALGLVAARLLDAVDPQMRARIGSGGIALLAFTIALTAVATWEIFEFGMDMGLGTREQDDLIDTMMDMTDGTMGAAVASAWIAIRPQRAADPSAAPQAKVSRSTGRRAL